MNRFGFATCVLCLSFAACGDGSRAPKVDELREIVLRGAPPEDRGGGLFGGGMRHSHREVLERIEEAADDPRVKGVFLRVSELGSAFGRITELREALLRVRAAKKPVHCYFDTTDNSGYALAAEVCEKISMSPSGLLGLTGLRAQSFYVRDLLERVGVSAELLQVGKFKGAADSLTRSDMAPEVRETLGALLDDLQADLGRGVQAGRSLDAAALARAIDEGPHTAASALSLHLIDAIAFDDEARSKAKTAAQAKNVVSVLEQKDDQGVGIFDLFEMFGDGRSTSERGKRLVLAYVDGTIGEGESEGADGIQSGPFVKAMRRYSDDAGVRAVVLRIDSPGGSALASDKMWHAVRRVAKHKPVVVSIGDMAASGGYYIACAGTQIFASPSSIVGSIGVVGGKVVADKLAAQLGVHAESLTRGRNANWMSPVARFSDSERKALQRALEQTYGLFVSRVREGRKLDDAQLAKVAEGRIMSGKRATELGLVDRAGGLTAALDYARKKTGATTEDPIEVWPKDRSILKRLTSAMSESEAHALLSQFVPESMSHSGSIAAALERSGLVPHVSQALTRSALATLLLQGDAKPLAVLPFAFELE